MLRGRLPYLLIPFAALIAIHPLIVHGCSCGHDFDFHLLNWLEAAQQFRHGNLHPSWAFTPAYGAGEPRFVFYPPLSWTIGAILGSIFKWTWTPILYTWLILTAAGASLYRLARTFTSQTAALLAACFYIVNPYTLFTAFERTAYAELLAAVWIPLLLHALLRPDSRGGVTIPRIAIPIALLWLTNAPAAVMSCYALALLTTIRLITTPADTNRSDTNPGAPSSRRSFAAKVGIVRSTTAPAHSQPTTRLQLAINTIAGTALGLGLAAFYILPAAYERRYVLINMALVPYLRVQDNFLFHHTNYPYHDQVLHSASVVAVIMLALTAIAFIVLYLSNKRSQSIKNKGVILSEATDSLIVSSAVEGPASSSSQVNVSSTIYALLKLTIAIAFLLTPITKPIWLHAPELAFLQFPWRILAILAAILGLTISLALRTIHLKATITAAIVIIVAVALTIPAYHAFNQPCDEEDNVTARVDLFHSNLGTDPTDEYTPATADNDSLAHADPPYWLSPNPDAPPPPNAGHGPAPLSPTIDSPIPQYLILNLRDYPAWHIQINNALVTARNNRDDGLTSIPIPAGHLLIHITYTTLPDHIAGDILTLLSFAILIAIVRHNLQPKKCHPERSY